MGEDGIGPTVLAVLFGGLLAGTLLLTRDGEQACVPEMQVSVEIFAPVIVACPGAHPACQIKTRTPGTYWRRVSSRHVVRGCTIRYVWTLESAIALEHTDAPPQCDFGRVVHHETQHFEIQVAAFRQAADRVANNVQLRACLVEPCREVLADEWAAYLLTDTMEQYASAAHEMLDKQDAPLARQFGCEASMRSHDFRSGKLNL